MAHMYTSRKVIEQQHDRTARTAPRKQSRPARKRGPYTAEDHKKFLERMKKENYEVYLRLKDKPFPTPAGIQGGI